MSTTKVTIHIGNEKVDVERIENRTGGGALLDLKHEDGRMWRIVVKSTGKLDYIETTWRDGELADLDEPDWLDDVLAQLTAPV